MIINTIILIHELWCIIKTMKSYSIGWPQSLYSFVGLITYMHGANNPNINLFHKWRLFHGNEARTLFAQIRWSNLRSIITHVTSRWTAPKSRMWALEKEVNLAFGVIKIRRTFSEANWYKTKSNEMAKDRVRAWKTLQKNTLL